MTFNLHTGENLGATHLFMHVPVTREHTHGGVKQRGVRRARAAEEAMLWHQVLVGVHCVLHVLAADQAAEQSVVRGRRQVHAVIALSEKNDQSEHGDDLTPERKVLGGHPT